MKKSASFTYVGILALVALLAFSLTAWNQSAPPPPPTLKDTTPHRGDHKVKNIDEAIAELDRASAQLEREMKKPLPPIPPADVAKMKVDIDKALKDLDPEKMKAEMEKAMKDIDCDKIKADLQASMAKVDVEKQRAELERVKNIELPKIQEQMKDLKPKIEAEMKKAKTEMEKAKKEMQEYKGFLSGLEKDGLINPNEAYTIEHKDGQLIINGKTQPAEVYIKYKTFLEKQKDFTIEKDSDKFNIHKD